MAYSYKDLYDLYKDDKKVDNVPQSGGVYTFDVLSDIYGAGVTDDNEDYATQLFDPKNIENYKAKQIESDAINQKITPKDESVQDYENRQENTGIFGKIKNLFTKSKKKYEDLKEPEINISENEYTYHTPLVLEQLNNINKELSEYEKRLQERSPGAKLLDFLSGNAKYNPNAFGEKGEKKDFKTILKESKEDSENFKKEIKTKTQEYKAKDKTLKGELKNVLGNINENKYSQGLILPEDQEEERKLISEKMKYAEEVSNFLAREDVKTGFWDGLKHSIKEGRFVPFAYNINQNERMGDMQEALGKLTDEEREVLDIRAIREKYQGNDELSDYELSLLENMQMELINSRIDKGIPYALGESLVDMGRYGLEFAMLGGVAKGITTGAKAIKPIAKILPKSRANSFVSKLAGEMTQALVQTGLNVPAVENKTLEYTLPQYDLIAGEQGESLVQQASEGDDPLRAFTKGFASVYVETFSERVGGLITRKEAGQVYRTITKRLGLVVKNPENFLQKSVIGRVLSKRNDKTLTVFGEYLKKSGFNGILQEIFEEEFNEPFQAKLDSREYYNPITTPEGRTRLIMEAIGIGMYGGLLKIPDKTVNQIYKWREKREPKPIEIPIEEDEKIPTENLPEVIKEELQNLQQEETVPDELAGIEDIIATDGITEGVEDGNYDINELNELEGGPVEKDVQEVTEQSKEDVTPESDIFQEYNDTESGYFEDEFIGKGTFKEAIDNIGGPDNVERRTIDRTQIKSTENVSLDTERGQRALEEIKSGKRVPIVARPTGPNTFEVEDGNHRLKAYGELKINDIPIITTKQLENQVEEVTEGIAIETDEEKIVQAKSDLISAKKLGDIDRIEVPGNFRSEEEKKSFEQLAENPEEMVGKYIQRFGTDVSSDSAKLLFNGYKRTNAIDYGRASGIVADKVLNKLLLEKSSEPEKSVLMLAGGTGSGKTTTRKELPEAYTITYDSTLSDYERAKKYIDKATELGYKVDIVYVYRDPFEAFKNGVMARFESGLPRTVTVSNHINSHRKAKRVILDLSENYKENENVEFRIIENSLQGRRVVDVNYIKSTPFNKKVLNLSITNYAKQLFDNGQISNEQYQALLGRERQNVPRSNGERDYQRERKEEKVSRENRKGREENISLASQNNNEKSNKQNIQEKSKPSSFPRGREVIENNKREVTERTESKEKGTKRRKEISGRRGSSSLSSLNSKGTTLIDEYELRGSPKPGTREFKIYKRIQGLLKSYDRDFTIGEKYLPRGALGVYYPSTKNIRVDSINSLSVFAHEFTHYLDAKLNITKHLSKPELTKELSRIYVQYYPGAEAGHNSRLRQLEGFATLLQKYVEFPSTMEAEYPLLVSEFLQPNGEYYEPLIGKMIEDMNQLVSDYQGLKALDKIGTRVSIDDTGIDRKSFFTSQEKLRQQLVDKVYPLEVIAKKAGIDNKPIDPSLWARAYSAVNGIVGNNISTKRGYWAFTDLESGFQKKYEYNWKTLIDRLEKNNRADSFGYYLVARRQHFLYKELDLLGNRKGQLEVIVKALNKITEPNKLSAFNRDLKSMLEEDYGIEIIPSTIKNGKPEYTAKNLERFKRETNRLLQKLKKEYEEFKSVLDNDGFSRQVVDDAYKQNSEAYEYEEKMFDSLVKADLELLHNPEVQLIDKATFDKLNNTQGYASFKRQFYDEFVGETDIPSTSKVKKTKISSLMRRTGSERTIINPIYSSMINHSEIVRKSMRQVVYNRIGSLGSSAAIPNIFQEQELKIHYDKNSEKVTYPQEKDPNIIMARLNYKRQPILVNKEVKTIIDDILDYKSIGKFSKLYLSVSRMFTLGTTGAFVPFTVTNFFMDQVTASVNSYNKFIPLYSPFSTYIKQKINKNSIESKYYEEYLVMGGERQTFMGWQKMSPSQLFDKIKSEKSLIDKAASIGSKALDILQKPATASEIITRAAEYVAARKAGKSQVVALEEAGRVTAPFHHTGVWGSTSHDITGAVYIRGLPFFNASLQVLDQLARVSTTSSGRKRIMFVGLVLMAAYLASLDYLFRNASDDQKEQYKGLAPEELANFIYFPNPSGKGLWRFRVPAPITIPATVLNMIVSEAMFDTKYDSDEYIDLVTSWIPDQFNLTEPTKAALAWVPQFFKPTTHVIFNVKEYPEVRPLVNQGLSNRPNAEQYNEGTTPLAKKLGEMMNLSPIKIDYFVTGTFGRASKMLMGQPENLNPLTAFQRDYWLTSDRRITDFYNTRDENDKKYSSVQNHRGEYENITEAEIKEIYRIKAITDDVENLLDEFREVDIEKNQGEASKLRSKILTNVEGLENPKYYPKDFVEWSEDRIKTRYKNKSKK
jgi:uncharacterized protein (UPF0248 family)